MKATMQMNVDTTWGNRIHLTVETELDNPSVMTTRELSALMIYSLSLMLAEVRLEDDRFKRQDDHESPHEALRERLETTREQTDRSERERARLEEMERVREEEARPS